jgi:uncharacterized membrane protein YjjP (DUF1212 family)
MELQVKEGYKQNATDYLLCLALDVGEGLLKNGAEVARVEDTVERICRAYGAEHVEVFCIISVINAAIRMPDGSYSSQIRRVRNITNNFNKIEQLNSLSREVCQSKPGLNVFDDKLHELKSNKTYPTYVHMLAHGVGAGGFAFFFGGDWKDALVSFIIGLVIALIDRFSPSRMTGIAKTVVSSFVSSLIAVFSVRLGIGSDEDVIIIAFIMLLVPGVAFGTAMRDLFCGDLAAGSLKILQAFLLALMIAFGYTMAMLVL